MQSKVSRKVYKKINGFVLKSIIIVVCAFNVHSLDG